MRGLFQIKKHPTPPKSPASRNHPRLAGLLRYLRDLCMAYATINITKNASAATHMRGLTSRARPRAIMMKQ